MKKILLYLIALVCVTNSTDAQVQGWQWAKRSSINRQGVNTVRSNSVISTDKLGNVYMTALIADSNFNIDGHSLSTWGKTDILLTSFNCEGIYRWSKVIGSSNDSDQVLSVKTDTLGDVYVCGTMTLKSQSGGSVNGHLDTDTSIIGNSYRTMFLAKWDTAGNFKWLRMPQPDTIGYLNANLYTSMFGMDVSPDGTVHLACYLTPGGYAGYKMRINTSGAYVIRYDANGNYLGNTALDMHYSGISNRVDFWLPIYGTRFKYDSVHSRYLVYGFASTGIGGIRYIGNNPVFENLGYLASFNASNGSVAFQKIQTTNPTSADTILYVRDLALDRSGNIFVVGEALPGCIFNGIKFDNPLSQKSAFIIKMDGNTGDTLWTKLGRRSVNRFYHYAPQVWEADRISVSNGVVSIGGK